MSRASSIPEAEKEAGSSERPDSKLGILGAGALMGGAFLAPALGATLTLEGREASSSASRRSRSSFLRLASSAAAALSAVLSLPLLLRWHPASVPPRETSRRGRATYAPCWSREDAAEGGGRCGELHSPAYIIRITPRTFCHSASSSLALTAFSAFFLPSAASALRAW